jgi:hypothetical protein
MIGALGFNSRRGLGIFLFTTASRTALGSTQPPIQWVPGAFSLSLVLKRPGSEANLSPPSSAEVKGWVELYLHSPNMPSWCGAQLKKAQGLYLHLPLPINYTQLLIEEVYSVYTVCCRFTYNKLSPLSTSVFLWVDEINFYGLSLMCLVLSEYLCKVCWYSIHLCNYPSFTVV